MSWTLTASGHTPTPADAEDWAAVEKDLVEQLQKVLSDPRFGCSSSRLAGNYVDTALHSV